MTTRMKKQNKRMGEMVIKDPMIAKQFRDTTTTASKYSPRSVKLLHISSIHICNKS